MSTAAKRAKAPEKTIPSWRVLKGPLPAPPKMMVLLEVQGNVWTFQHPRSQVLYRCELDAVVMNDGSPTFRNGWDDPITSGSPRPMRRDSLGSAVRPSEGLSSPGAFARWMVTGDLWCAELRCWR
jgi:hypothetical protein